jgi:ABC-type multidrug transport system permease subunit
LKALAIFITALRQKLRDRLGLALTLLTAPAFVVLYWAFFTNAAVHYDVAVLDADVERAGVSPWPDRSPGRALLAALADVEGSDGTPLFAIRVVASRAALDRALRSGAADVGLLIPAGFSRALFSAADRPAEVTLVGDGTGQAFRVASVLVGQVAEAFGHEVRGSKPAVQATARPVGLSGSRTPFELYVPGLMVFTVIMLIFSASMSVVREVEAGTLARLRLAPVSTLSILTGMSAAQFVLGALAVVLTLLSASLLGFRSQGSIALALLIAGVASLASVGVGMVVASISRTMTRAFLLSSVAMFLLVLFSGVIFPRPSVALFSIGETTIDLFDLLPTTHMGVALGKVLNLGAGVREVGYELLWLTLISLLSFAVGGWFFARSARPSAQAWEGLP